jgi:hypothetical protein
MYLLGQCSTEDFNLASCQCAILSILQWKVLILRSFWFAIYNL